jgi:sec-independent protein translocase protein TatB
MFDIAWSELLVIGIVALIVVGPKELPNLLRTIGKVLGAVRKQASEFRAQFDEAMRETEFDKIKQDLQGLRLEAEETLRSAGQSIKSQFDDAIGDPDHAAADAALGYDADAHDADGLPIGDAANAEAGVMGSAAAAAAAAASEAAGATGPSPSAFSAAASAASAAAGSEAAEPAGKMPAKAGA